jgi:16S rRNA (uracil1498-N3)-methyltransferase
MEIFYCAEPSNGIRYLNEEESRHCIKVLRHHPGDEIVIVDGNGNWFESKLDENANEKKCSFQVLRERINYHKRNYKLHIAISPTKQSDRFEWFLEKATEMGVDEITPVICQRTERVKMNLLRMEKILISAMKQSLQAYLPKLFEPVLFKNFIENKNTFDQRFIASCNLENRIEISSLIKKNKSSIILIGPEGDFTDEETDLASQNNFTAVSLGENRLRTETAGVAACVTFAMLNK